MQKLYDLIAGNENWLIKRILHYAKVQNYVMYTSTLEEAWRMSILGLSTPIMIALKASDQIPEIPINHDFLNDPIAAFGIHEAKKHRKRGIHFTMFMGLLKYYCQSYVDLIEDADFDRDYRAWSLLYINRAFDRIEIGFAREWIESGESKRITELQDYNRTLTNEKNWYLTVFESLPAPVVLLNTNNTIKNMNFAAAQLFELSETSGAYYYDEERPATSLPCFHEELKLFASSSDSELIFEKTIELKGVVRCFEVKFAKMLDVSEKFSGVVLILNDISDRKRMEDSFFHSSQKEWEDTFNTITDMITIHDTNFNIVRANTAAKKFFNLSCSSEIPKKCYHYFHGDTCRPETCSGCESLKTGKPQTVEMFEPRLGKFVEIRAIPKLDRSSNISGVIHVVRDISERKKLEEQLHESRKMEAIGHLAGGIAHDFSNLLTAVKGSAYIIRKNIPEDGSLMPLVDQILDMTERATSLIHGLLAYSRKQVMTTAPADLNELIRKIETVLVSLLGEVVEIEINLADCPLRIMADPVQIDQVLMNLATNARDALPAGGRLCLRTERTEIDLATAAAFGLYNPGAYVSLSVTDDGVGIAEEDIARVFEPFYTTKEVGKGTGLGLAIVYGIIKQHGGHITVHSKLGMGTQFTVYLPLIDSAADDRTSTADVCVIAGREKIRGEENSEAEKTIKNTLRPHGSDVGDEH